MKEERKIKNFLMILIISILLLFIPSIVKATVAYTREFPDNQGTIILNLTGLTLDDKTSYSYALTTKSGTPEKWFNLIDYTKNTASIQLSSSNGDIKKVLQVTDKGLLYIKNNTDNSYIVNGLEINLKLPYINGAFSKDGDSYNLAHPIYNIGNEYTDIHEDYTFTSIQKITDASFIQKFLDVKKTSKNITSLENDLPPVPTTGYNANRRAYYKDMNDGLYIIWVKRAVQGWKTIYTAIVHDGLPEATTLNQYVKNATTPKVKEIKVISPESGTYKTNQTVKIKVIFTEKITGTTTPTLKIKFGQSSERSVTNGTIKDDYIEYSYNIGKDDKGQLATVSLSGGAIKSSLGIDAELSCPIITGNTIKANTEGTTTNNTDNQDKTNNDNNKDKPNNTQTNNDNNKDKPNNNNNDTSTKKDDSTVAGGKIPQTGAGIGLGVAMIAIACVGILVFFKYNKLRDI